MKTGPRWKMNSLVLREKTLVPRMSAGIMSGVPWMRRKSRARKRARVLTVMVLATPGTPSTRAWPPQRKVRMACSINLGLAGDDSAELGLPLFEDREDGADFAVVFDDLGHAIPCFPETLLRGLRIDFAQRCDVVVEATDLGEGRSGTGIIVIRLTRGFEVGGEHGGIAGESGFDGGGDGSRAGAEGFRGQTSFVREKLGETTLSGGDGDAAGSGFGVESTHGLDEFERRSARRLHERAMRATAAGEAEEEQRGDAAGLHDDAGERGSVGGGPGTDVHAVHELIEVDGAIGTADAGEEQTQVAVVEQAEVGERRGGGPPDDFAAAPRIRDDDGSVATELRDANGGIVAIPVNGSGHFQFAGASEGAGAFGAGEAEVGVHAIGGDDLRIGKEDGDGRAGGDDAAAAVEEIDERLLAVFVGERGEVG